LSRNQPNRPSKLKAVFECRSVPIDLFGSGPSRNQRKFVYFYLAAFANPDGTGAFPSRRTIARDTGLSIRGLANILKWLKEHRLIESSPERSNYNTCVYSVLFSEEDQARCRAILASEEKEHDLRGKASKTKLARKSAALARWRNRGEEHSIPHLWNAAYIGNAAFTQPSFKPSLTERETKGHNSLTTPLASQIQKPSGQEQLECIQAAAKQADRNAVFTIKSNRALIDLCEENAGQVQKTAAEEYG
jgi:Helix-turn-helix domain